MPDLRSLIDLVRSASVAESLEDVTIYGKTIPVLRNPTVAELTTSSKRKFMRGIVDPATGDTYWWPLRAAIHSQVARELGVIDPTRLEIRNMVLDIISGGGAAIRSSSVRYLTSRGIGVKWGREVISLDDYAARLDHHARLNEPDRDG